MRYTLIEVRWPDVWLEKRVRRSLCPDAVSFHAVNSLGQTVAAAAFEQWTANAVGVHVAAEGRQALRYAPLMLTWALERKPVVWCLVDAEGPSARLARKLGFVDHGRLPGAGTAGDAVLLALTRERHVQWQQHLREQRSART